MSSRGTFSGRFGVVAAVGGSVVGLGNIWRFPYVAGENGGAAFILVYIAVSFILAIPIMLSEFSIGRSIKTNSMRAFQRLAPNTQWKWVGYLGILTAFVILSFYCVIAGWALEFVKDSLLNNFAGKSTAEISSSFNAFVATGWQPIVWTAIFIAMSSFIVLSGIEKGIERYNKIFMPLLVLILIGLAINSLTLTGAKEGITFLLNPDFSKINGSVILQALGQSFFSLSLGMGCMITYGSYIKRNENLFKVAAMVSITDVTVAILSGIAIFPAVFSFGISPSSGPELVFITLPNVFTQMTGGYFISIIFFMLLFLAAITSSVSLFEVITAYVTEEMRFTRKKAVMLVTGSVLTTGIISALSQMPNSKLAVMGRTVFDLCDYLSSNIMLPVGGFFIVIFTGWVFSVKKFKTEITSEMQYGVRLYPFVRFMIKFIAPIIIGFLFLTQSGIVKF